MMKFLKAALPNLSIVLNICLLVIVYLDLRNPMMGFLVGAPFLTLVIACVGCSVASAVVLYCSWRKKNTASDRRKKEINT